MNIIKTSIFIFISLIISFNLYSIENKFMIATTTSTYDSGLLTYLNKYFEKKFNITPQVLSQGTGQAIRTAKDGNVEVLIVHHTKSELTFMNQGYGLIRHNLMYNDFIIVGPLADNKKCNKLKDKLNYIVANNLDFLSRGDDSGTHKKELELWKEIKFEPINFGNFYIEVGQGMGNTLLIANEKSAYTLTDRSTWISFKKKENLKIICESKPPLFNQYGVILVNPKLNNSLNIKSAKLYIDWLVSAEGKKLINNFKKEGEQLFYFNYY